MQVEETTRTTWRGWNKTARFSFGTLRGGVKDFGFRFPGSHKKMLPFASAAGYRPTCLLA